MARRGIDTDDPYVKVHPGRGSRPHTEQRPSHAGTALGMVTRIDRDHYRIRLDDPSLTKDSSNDITATKARELGRGKVVVGDRIAAIGGTSGRKGILARMVHIRERTALLHHSAENGDATGTEKLIVTNAAKLVIVTAVTDPEPRPHMIGRYLVTAYDAGMEPLIVFTRNDLANTTPLTGLYSPLGARCLAIQSNLRGPGTGLFQADDEQPDGGVEAVCQVFDGTASALMGHFGVGKSMLINAPVPGADRAIGHVNEVTGRGRHTPTNLQALELSGDDWVAGTPSVRSFGVFHAGSADVLRSFPDLARVAEDCPRGRTHEDSVVGCTLDEWTNTTDGPDVSRAPITHEERCARVESFRRLLAPSLEAKDPTRP